MRSRGSRTYHDPLHGAITLEGNDPTEWLLIQLIDTPAFQRLRRIRQLGTASLTFHGAEGSRFTHSLGVMAIARRVFDRLVRRYPKLKPYRPLVLCASLLHDIGHGPFSHTAEDIFQGDHELWTRRILREFPPVRQLLDHFSPTLVADLEQIYLKHYPIPLIWQLVSSQLDCDRLDYLMRDSYFTGASYGKLDLDRIILAMNYDPVSQQLVVVRKGQAAIEHYLVVRYFMYAQVYNHPKNIAAAWGLERAFHRARVLLKNNLLTADPTVTAWLSQSNQHLNLKEYLAADDNVFNYHLHLWQQNSQDSVLVDLCRRYLDRDLLKALDITHLKAEQQQDLQHKTELLLTQAGFIPEYYSGIRVALSRGYTLYQRGIKLQTPQGLQEISTASPLVQTLIQPFHRTWLLYPREIEAGLLHLADQFQPTSHQ
uniref:Metal dependent phosphohydrolase n=1 Tax=Cyanothece sp. (strain PCC 7425 / ATCC 29141) TaxID=395961 RepID=B8HWC4_CYAP4